MSSKSTSERPPTCQGPVRPGFTARRCMAHSSYCATSRGSGGRGPTTDIPFVKTKKQDYLQKCSDWIVELSAFLSFDLQAFTAHADRHLR